MDNEILGLLSSQQHIDTDVKCQLHDDCSVEYSPVVLGRNVCYIVGAVLVNSKNEVLFIQEAKPSCRGTWYLPAGRVEPNENLINAVKREVLEESGLVFQPSGLICVEQNTGQWMRFIFAGDVTGGNLKTTAEADAESLQAAWIGNLQSVRLRSRDILRVIDLAQMHYEKKQKNFSLRKFAVLPSPAALKILYLRVAVICKSQSHSISVLQFQKNPSQSPKLPVSCFKPVNTVNSSVIEILESCLTQSSYKEWKSDIVGILCLQHNGDSKLSCDGICLTILVNLKCMNPQTKDEPTLKTDCFSWHNVTEGEIYDCFNLSENQKNQCVPLIQLF